MKFVVECGISLPYASSSCDARVLVVRWWRRAVQAVLSSTAVFAASRGPAGGYGNCHSLTTFACNRVMPLTGCAHRCKQVTLTKQECSKRANAIHSICSNFSQHRITKHGVRPTWSARVCLVLRASSGETLDV